MRRIESATVVSSKNNPSFNFYPNLVVPVDPTGAPFLLFWPTSDTSMRIECHWFAPDWGGGRRRNCGRHALQISSGFSTRTCNSARRFKNR